MDGLDRFLLYSLSVVINATLLDYDSLNAGSDGLTYSKRFHAFHDRMLALWFRGRMTKYGGTEGIYPVGHDVNGFLEFDLRTTKGVLRFSTEYMELRSQSMHEECYGRIWITKDAVPECCAIDPTMAEVKPPRVPKVRSAATAGMEM